MTSAGDDQSGFSHELEENKRQAHDDGEPHNTGKLVSDDDPTHLFSSPGDADQELDGVGKINREGNPSHRLSLIPKNNVDFTTEAYSSTSLSSQNHRGNLRVVETQPQGN